MHSPLVQTLINFLVRRGLTLLGGSAAALTDAEIAQFIGVLLVIGNEIAQAVMAHQAQKQKGDMVPSRRF